MTAGTSVNSGEPINSNRPANALGNSLALAVIALGLAFIFTWSARFCEMHTADSILPALISTQHLTWFYWGQNRLGNLLPALTSFISDIDLNLKAQIFLRALGAAVGPAFFVLIMKVRVGFIAAYAAVLAAVILAEKDLLTHNSWTDEQPYGTSLALLVPAVLIAGRSSWHLDLRSTATGGLVLFLAIVALWVNLSLVLFIVPLFAGLAIVERSRNFVVLTAMTFVAYALNAALAKHIGGNEYVSFQFSLTATMKAISSVGGDTRRAVALLLLMGGLCAALMLRARHRILWAALVVLGSALIEFMVTANLQWVQFNLSMSRYFILPVTAIIAASAILMVEAIGNLLASSRLGTFLLTSASVALLIVSGSLIALPLNLSCRFMEHRTGIEEVANLVSTTKAAFVDGDYWVVWPAVFLANRNAREPVFGLAYRAEGARTAAKRYVRSHPHPVILCIGKPLADCIDRIESVLGQTLNASARVIAAGELANPKAPWVAAGLE